MDPSSPDENENPFDDVRKAYVSSTPLKQKPAKLTCPHCSKEYVSNFYFKKHFETHGAQGSPVAPADLNVSYTVHGDPLDVTLGQLGPGQDDSGVFQLPAVPTRSKKTAGKKLPAKKPTFVCTYCLKGYVCSRSYRNHMRTHTMQDASARIPDVDKIVNNSVEISGKALTHVANSPSEADYCQPFRELLGHIASISSGSQWKKFSHDLCYELVKSIANKKVMLPSALVNNLMDHMQNILSNFDLCDSFLETLGLCQMFDSDLLAHFILEFTLNFTTEVLKYMTATFRENVPQRLKLIEEPDKEDRQVIYYIAGSIMRGYLKIAKRTWQDVASAIKSKVLVGKPIRDVDGDSQWTSDVDRGGLLYVSVPCQSFFVNLTKIVYECKKSDGFIDYNNVILKVTLNLASNGTALFLVLSPRVRQ